MEPPEMSGIWVSYSEIHGLRARRSPGDKIRLLIVDDHTPYRQSLRSSFELEPDLEVVGEAVTGEDGVKQTGLLRPDMVLMDINMPGLSGMEATRAIADAYPGIPIVILTMFQDDIRLREARRAGASAFVMKDAGSDILIETVRAILSGSSPLMQSHDSPSEPMEQARTLHDGGDLADSTGTNYLLTSQERAILKHLARGLTNSQIAHSTNMSEGMVGTYIAEICRKLGLPDRAAAIRFARDLEA